MRSSIACALLAAGTAIPAHAGLQARDLDLDGAVDAYYDTSTDTSWYAQIIESSQPGAEAWARALDVFGVTGWHLPRIVQTAPCTGTSWMDITCPVELIDPLPPADFPFASQYWPNTSPVTWFEGRAENTIAFGAICFGSAWASDQCGVVLPGIAMHAGDVAAIPEPSTYLLLAVGLVAVAARGSASATRRSVLAERAGFEPAGGC
jgi:hypothetical protein